MVLLISITKLFFGQRVRVWNRKTQSWVAGIIVNDGTTKEYPSVSEIYGAQWRVKDENENLAVYYGGEIQPIQTADEKIMVTLPSDGHGQDTCRITNNQFLIISPPKSEEAAISMLLESA